MGDWADRPRYADMRRRCKLSQTKWEMMFIRTNSAIRNIHLSWKQNKWAWSLRLLVRESRNNCLSVHYVASEINEAGVKELSSADVNCKKSKKTRCQWRTPPWSRWHSLFINELRVVSRNGPTFCLWPFLYGAFLFNVPALPWGASGCILRRKVKFLHAALLLWW